MNTGTGGLKPAAEPVAPLLPPWMEGALLLASAVAAFFGCLQPIWDPDTYWHLSVGREIWRTGSLLRTETFSFEASQVPWADTNWLAHLLFQPLWNLGAYRALEFSAGVLGVLILFISTLSARVRGASVLAVSLCLGVWFSAFAGRLRLRPEAFALVLFATLVWLLCLLVRRGPGRTWILVALPLLFWLWIQIHGSWSYGALLLATVLAGRCLDAPGGSERVRCLKEGGLILGATALLLLVTPFGARLAAFPLTHLASLRDPTLVPIDEWKPSPWTRTTLPFLAAACALWAWSLLRAVRHRPRWTELLWTTSQGLLVFLWVRYSSFCWIALLPLGAEAVEAFLSKVRKLAIPVASLAALLLLLRTVTAGLAYSPTELEQARNYPVLESAYLRERGLSGNLFHTFVSGGYLSWRLYPQCRIFFDGRYFPFSTFLSDYSRSAHSPATFSGFLARYPFEIAIVPYSQAQLPAADGPPRPAVLSLFPRSGWNPVFFGPYGAVFLRTGIEKFAAAVTRDSYSSYFPGDEVHLMWEVSRGRVDPGVLRLEIDRALHRGLPPDRPAPTRAFRDALPLGPVPLGAPASGKDDPLTGARLGTPRPRG